MPRKRTPVDKSAAPFTVDHAGISQANYDKIISGYDSNELDPRRLIMDELRLKADGVDFLLQLENGSDTIELSIDDQDEPIYLSRTTAAILGHWLLAAAQGDGE